MYRWITNKLLMSYSSSHLHNQNSQSRNRKVKRGREIFEVFSYPTGKPRSLQDYSSEFDYFLHWFQSGWKNDKSFTTHNFTDAWIVYSFKHNDLLSVLYLHKDMKIPVLYFGRLSREIQHSLTLFVDNLYWTLICHLNNWYGRQIAPM